MERTVRLPTSNAPEFSPLKYADWLRQFGRSRDGKKALDELHALGIDNEHKWLERLVLFHCYRASQYDDRTDPRAQRRKRDKETIDVIPAQIDAIRTLRTFIEEQPNAAVWAFRKAVFDLDSKGFQYNGTKPSDTRLTLKDIDEILAAYQKGLEPPLPGIQAGPWMHRTQLGCLDYPKAIDRQTHLADAKINGLVFALTFIFKKWTSGAAADYVAARASFFIPGETMPRDGKPCAKQVKLFAKAALKTEVNVKSVLKNLQRHPDIRLVGWPKMGQLGDELSD